MSHTRTELHNLFMTKNGLAVILLFLFFAFPSAETWFAPVVRPIHKIEFVAVEGGTIIKASATKVRGCGWRQTTWYLGQRGDRNAVLLTNEPHQNAPRPRMEGVLYWSRIFVPVDPETARSNTYADAFHSCYPYPEWAPWAAYLTRSKFYDPLIETANTP